jgi:hypothetical protein
LVSGFLNSKTPISNTIVVRGLGILPSGILRDGTLSVSLWSKFQPFQEIGFEFEVTNPSDIQPAKQILVSISDRGNFNVPATKAFGSVQGISEKFIDEKEGSGGESSQVLVRLGGVDLSSTPQNGTQLILRSMFSLGFCKCNSEA